MYWSEQQAVCYVLVKSVYKIILSEKDKDNMQNTLM